MNLYAILRRRGWRSGADLEEPLRVCSLASRLTCMAVGVLLAFPAASLAANAYVDGAAGNDAINSCLASAFPCKTIAAGLARAGTGDSVFVQGGSAGGTLTYTERLTLTDGKSIVHQDFAPHPGGPAVVRNGAGALAPAITVSGDSGVIEGFTIRSDADGISAISASAAVRIVDDLFDSSGHAITRVSLGGSSPIQVRKSTFTDTDPTHAETGISSSATGRLIIKRNTFVGFPQSIAVNAGAPKIASNEISGTRYVASGPYGISATGGSTPTITDNYIHDSVEDGVHQTYAVLADEGTPVLSQNLISGYDIGVGVLDAPARTRLSSDVITNTTRGALVADDSGTDDLGVSDVTATNESWLLDTGPSEASVTAAKLKLDSSIVGRAGLSAFSGGSCTITYSDGPTMIPGGDGCAGFQTTANPRFKVDGYHLRALSPLIDAGNPTAPGPSALDIDGDPRALDGPDNGSCAESATRDIGADEYRC
jgi:hypothetical protein